MKVKTMDYAGNWLDESAKWQEDCIKLRHQLKENGRCIEFLVAECNALKASNSDIREQLGDKVKQISELQHVVRLLHGQLSCYSPKVSSPS